jgi:hypothetical protein
MKTSTAIIFIFLCIILYACNNGNKASNETEKKINVEKGVNIESNVEKRIDDSNTNSEKSNNLWIDLHTYAKYYIEKDSHGFIDMTIPRLILHIGGDSIFKSIDNYFQCRNDYDYTSVKSALEEGVFLISDSAIIAFVTQTREIGKIKLNETTRIRKEIELIAESIDNGVSWKFADIGHLKHVGIENFYSKNDCVLIHNHLAQDKIDKVLKIYEITYGRNKQKTLISSFNTSANI